MPTINQFWVKCADVQGSYNEANCQGASVIHFWRIMLCGLVPDEPLHKRHVHVDDGYTGSAKKFAMS